MMTVEARTALAWLVHAIRGDWDVTGVESALRKGKALEAAEADDVRAVCDAAVAAALDPRNRTPAVIPLAGPHWQPATWSPTRRYDPQTSCDICSQAESVCRSTRNNGHEFTPVRPRRAAGAS